MRIFADMCWRCWPANCKCAPAPDEFERMKSELFLLERELIRENRRAKTFARELASLSNAVITAAQTRLADGGLDNLSADLYALSVHSKAAMATVSEPSNADRVSDLLRRIQAPSFTASQAKGDA